ncbi:MAG: CYTH domain-containing protein [Solirubrobacterales bacterium]|nr:CYTH domain-containing protein [Solirubrobacterales bacterium]MBV9366063.1 CYTH domain-containing protein [Solirubrobacterales bacterium]MBV9808563.1 CYTH domain-containing protein [Solirubrobacterales bacterium]
MPAGTEIERKFLVDRPPADLDGYPAADIDQGYIAITEDGVEVRIRSYGGRAFLTIKSAGAGVRLEEEIEIDERRFRSLWPLTEGRRIRKRRYLISSENGIQIELDVYRDHLGGLVTAEVEFGSEDAAAAFIPPPWLDREITDEPGYKNQRLAVHGLPKTTDS